MVAALLSISIIIQLTSAYYALKLTRVTRIYVAWSLIALAILIMSFRQGVVLYTLFIADHSTQSHLTAEIITLLISILMLVGLIQLNPYLKLCKESSDSVKKINDQLRNEINSRKVIQRNLSQVKTTLDQTNDSVFMFNTDSFKFFYVNQAAMNQVGYTEEELLQMTPLDIKPEFTEESFRHLINVINKKADSSIKFRTKHKHKNGKLVPVEISLQLVCPDEEECRFVAIVRDISYHLKIEDDLRAANEELETFIYKASHDLRGPLLTTKGILNLSAVEISDKKSKKLFGLLYQSNNRLIRVLDDLVQIMNMKRRNLIITDVSFSDIVSQVLDANTISSELKQFKVLVDIDSEIVIKSDESIIKSIINKIIDNSINYKNENIESSTIRITVNKYQNGVMLEIEDNGIGIIETEQPKVFDLFRKSSYQSKGSGAGLYFVKQSVSKLRGTINLSSQETVGTKIDIYLPEYKVTESVNNIAVK